MKDWLGMVAGAVLAVVLLSYGGRTVAVWLQGRQLMPGEPVFGVLALVAGLTAAGVLLWCLWARRSPPR